MSSLTVFDFNAQGIRFENREGRVWVCLTDMAKACNKKVNDWNRLSSTTEFLKEFEGITGISVIQSRVGNIPEAERGTWAIEEVAIEFAGWCSVSFKIWMIQQIKTLMTEGTVSLSPATPTDNRAMLKSVLDDMWADIKQSYPEINKRLIDGAKLNGYGRLFPELKDEAMEAKKLLSATSKEETLPVSPTELGVKFFELHPELSKAPSGQKVNLALTLLELQEKSNDKLCPYRLTSTGEEYGELQIETCKGHNKAVYRIRWHLEVLELIEDTLLTLSKTNTKSLVR